MDVDFESLNQWVTFFIGIGVALVTAYATMKQQGLIAYPARYVEAGKAKIKDNLEKIDELTSECAVVQEVKSAVGNISTVELAAILKVAAEHANHPGGYTTQDAQDVGKMIIEAAKSK